MAYFDMLSEQQQKECIFLDLKTGKRNLFCLSEKLMCDFANKKSLLNPVLMGENWICFVICKSEVLKI